MSQSVRNRIVKEAIDANCAALAGRIQNREWISLTHELIGVAAAQIENNGSVRKTLTTSIVDLPDPAIRRFAFQAIGRALGDDYRQQVKTDVVSRIETIAQEERACAAETMRQLGRERLERFYQSANIPT